MKKILRRIERIEEYTRHLQRGLTRSMITRLSTLQAKRGWMPLTEYNELQRLLGLPENTAIQTPDGRILVVLKDTVGTTD